MLTRDYTPPTITLEPTSAPPALPGLVSSLRPLRRTLAQLNDEAALLRRFTYKNKNQFKGTGWWRRIIHADRATSRAADELKGLLSEFGVEGDKDEPAVIKREELLGGLLRLPRAMLVTDKTIEVLLSCASILEQLVHSRAFLAFALVIVSLVARLHALFVVLRDELSRTSGVLVKLAQLNKLLPALKKPLQAMAKEARACLPLDSAGEPTSLPFTSATSASISEASTPAAASPARNDELGAVVSRSALSSKPALPLASSSRPSPLPAIPPSAPSPAPEPKKKRSRPPSAASSAPPSRPQSPSAALFPFDLDPPAAPSPPRSASSSAPKPSKRPRVVEAEGAPAVLPKKASSSSNSGVRPASGPSGREEKVKDKAAGAGKKKSKKRKAGGDEIDDIFG
ncbi:hypothetical protein JCM8097_007852 [Rhodosporidiobolus ruineniae]